MIYEAAVTHHSASLASYYLQNGNGTHAYRYFGVHRLIDRQGWCYAFRVCAPGADQVSLVGEWDNWEPKPMYQLPDCGVWELIVHADICPEGLRYKYRIEKSGTVHYKSDPYARKCESGGEGASYICTEQHYLWQDRAYMERRMQVFSEHERYDYPINVYEVVLSDWFREENGTSKSIPFTGYRTIADMLAQYASDMGFTHVLIDNPCDQSSGRYGITSYFAPDGAMGSPDDFAYFVDRMHKEQIGVIARFECCRLAVHSGGLTDFDGENMYTAHFENQTYFRYEDPYATLLLYSSALFWLREYHLDGLYIDAQKMKHLQRSDVFLSKLSESVRTGVPDALMLIRGNLYRNLSAGSMMGGGGFDLVSDARSESALLDCFAMNPTLRIGRQAWREPARYLYAENGILALSSAITEKQYGSVMGSLYGSQAEKFAALRLLLMFMYCLPGKKLLFMGTELGQQAPWRLGEGVEWFLQELESHAALHAYARSLGRFYRECSMLWDCDCTKEGMAAVPVSECPDGVIAFKRFDRIGQELCVVLNFGMQQVKGVRVATGGRYPYYGCGFHTGGQVPQERYETDKEGNIILDLEGLQGIMLTPLEPRGGFWL